MDKLNAVEKCRYIENKYKEYLSSSFEFGNSVLQKRFNDQLTNEDLFKGPYVSLNLPFKRGKSINELIDEGILSAEFKKLGNINLNRPLYAHQEEAIRRIEEGRSVVITTGTGSGKTESFLFPILNDILKDIENGENSSGIRAVFLYPMNALVNDQLDRVRTILKDYPKITYGFFTGETKEVVSKNYREEHSGDNDQVIPINELVSREEIREEPPHLLFTNYSMLEYLLIRPVDAVLFKPEYLKNWNFIVLDEAHSYYGSKGIEISLLMRRLVGLAPKKPRFILTSATLGTQGESEERILSFANKLTSVNFEENDIIFSDKIPFPKDQVFYRMSPNDYTKIKESLKNLSKIKNIAEKYKSEIGATVEEILYNLLCSDETVYEICKILQNKSRTFNFIKENLKVNIKEADLIALIDLINIAEKNGVGLFDLKYHSFIRPLVGAYITLSNPIKLSLSKTNTIDGLKAFELGNCKYCNEPYIIGRIKYDEESELFKLYQNKEIDIYENYGDNKSVKLDYFLLQDSLNDDIEEEFLEEHEICIKCGSIRSTENLNSRQCNCNPKYKVKIYKVNEKKEKNNHEFTLYNNINQCPICGHKSSTAGVVKSLDLGKDEATALIAQILLEAMEEIENETPTLKKFSLRPQKNIQGNVPFVDSAKQFLSFSDSRQQASFANVFFNANHTRLLRKRIIWEVIKKENYRDLTVDEMTSTLSQMIKDKNLFENDLSPTKNAWTAVLCDLLKVDGINDGEGLGLYYFDLDLTDIANSIDEEDIEEAFGHLKINKQDFLTIMQVVLSIFKLTPAINYVKSTLTEEEKKENLKYRRFNNYVMYQSSKKKSGIRSLLPIDAKDNMVVRYVLKVCNCSHQEAIELINVIFNNFLVATLNMSGITPLVKKHEKEEAYQIDASRYIVKNYRTSPYYRCKKCGRLTPYNVKNICVRDKCDGELERINPDEILKNNFYRNQYMNKKIERIIAKEHTAQIDREKAKMYQEEFKNKKINILFCSTTFEMGIDLGSLETVFMRNIPPTPANYVQRAGRAGRRRESSAYILTYCGAGSHDYTYFCEPEKMISGIIDPPHFDVMNDKIITRHLMSSCLGYFFREYPGYFKTIENMVFGDGKEKFENFINAHPKKLNEYINKKVLPEACYKKYHNFKWFTDMGGSDIKLSHFIEEMREIKNEYQDAMEKAEQDQDYLEANYYKNQIERINNTRMLDSLSKYSVIPKYGFPIDLVELQVYRGGVIENIDKNGRAGLSRDLKIAISEYAPDSEIIVDGKKYRSQYITLPKKNDFPKNYFHTCENCHKVNLFVSGRNADKCKYCNQPIENTVAEYFIEPIYGFKTGLTKESSQIKPKRSYAGEVFYIGGGIIDDAKCSYDDLLSVETSMDDELMVLNRSKFYMCPKCGYSEIIKGARAGSYKVKEHNNCRQYKCENDKLESLRIGHKFKTDVTRLNIPVLTMGDRDSWEKALSFLYAMLEGVSNALQIDRMDINGILEPNLETMSYDLLLYDDVPGGAGHVKRLLSKKAIIKSLRSALNKVSQKCCDEETSCYNCLRNYYNQLYHSHLKRGLAKDVAKFLLENID